MLRLVATGIATIGVATAMPAADAQAAPAPHQALLVGQLGVEGGALPGTFHPGPGSVEVEFDRVPLVIEHPVGPSGNFRIPLGPGSYTVIGCGPSAAAGPSSQCSQPKNVTLAPGQVDHIRLVWAMVP
jgi:hypothetical protein